MNRYINIKLWAITAMIILGFSSCNENALIDTYTVLAPVLEDFTPKSGEIGSEITITGKNLQRVDTVLIGGGLAELKYRINGEEMVVTVISSSRNGQITVSNSAGKSQSSTEFNIIYLTPTVNEFPQRGTVNQDIVLEGNNLNVIETVTLGDIETTIISKRKNELVFRVPFTENEETVALRLNYFDGEKQTFIGPEGNFIIEREAPEFYTLPTSLTKYIPAKIEGTLLNLIDALYINDIKLLIKYRNDSEITFDMPTDYFDGNMTGTLKAIYYGAVEITLVNNFEVYADANEPRYYSHNNVLLSARIGFGGTENAFFDAETGMIYHSCNAHDNRLDIDFYLYDQAGYVQLYSPNAGGNTVKNYKCEGISIDLADTNWDDFYGNSGIDTRFKLLHPDSINHRTVIEAYEAGTIVKLNDKFFEGIAAPGSSSPRIYRSNGDSGYSVESGHFSIDKYNIGWVRNNTTGKNGIIKFTGMPQEAVNGRIPELNFDIIWSK